jgi:hypothetical protein
VPRIKICHLARSKSWPDPSTPAHLPDCYCAGVVLEQTNSFSPIFYITGVLYLSSFVLWVTRMRSLPLLIRAPKPEGGERTYRTTR